MFFGNRYQLLEPIRRSGMSTVYRGRDLLMQRDVAIKVLDESLSVDPEFVARFQRELKAVSALQHPNIIQVYDYGQTDGKFYIIMELIEGTDLRRYLRARGVLTIDRAITIAHGLALGLGAEHHHDIVHKSVSPHNILIGRDGSIKLTTFSEVFLSTIHYYSPEQELGEAVGPTTDVYALGIIMYEMLTGRTPFDGETPVAIAMQHIQDAPIPPSRLNPNISPSLEKIILRCLEELPEMRYRDGNALAHALDLLNKGGMSE